MAQRIHPGLVILLALLVISLCVLAYLYLSNEPYQPLHGLHPKDFPSFVDDMDRSSLIDCTRRHLSYLQKQDPERIVSFGTDSYSIAWLLHSTDNFLKKLEEDPSEKELRRFLADNYLVYQVGGRKGQGRRQMLVTGYYEPVFEGNLTKQPPFLTPIYTLPPSLVNNSEKKGEKHAGRLNQNEPSTAYWSRREIETNPGLLSGYELAFLKDPVDAFLLHIQGSGRIRFPDSSVRTVRFAGTNGLEYKSIGKLLVDEKRIPLDEITIPVIRAYLLSHPEQQQRILHHNPRFVFFSWGNERGPKGSYGIELSPGRSIAVDDTALPCGSFGYLVSRIPKEGADGRVKEWLAITRFVFPQDSGAAIKGTGRVDIFLGHGEAAEFAANHLKEKGSLYFLVEKPPQSTQ
ncbi:MAG: MltA domain-containing protein [Desulforhopalus sp.]|nr:MltA domain-containing protein [Desulforhopalus sp.]